MAEAYSDHPDGLIAAICGRIDGCCIFCEERLIRKKGRPNTVTCGQLACVRAYQRAIKRDRKRFLLCEKQWPPDWMRREGAKP